MKILTTAHGCEDYSYAIVDLDPHYVLGLSKAFADAKARFKHLSDLSDMRFSSGAAVYYSAAGGDLSEAQQALIDKADAATFAVIPDGLEVGLCSDDEARTEADMLVVDDRFVFWTGGLRHSPEWLETPLIGIDEIRALAKTTKPKAAKAKPKRRAA